VLTKCTADPKLSTVQTDLGQVGFNVQHVTDKALCICLHYWTAHRADQYRKGLFKGPIFVLTKYLVDPKLPTVYGGPCSIILACTFTSTRRVTHTVLVYHLGRTSQNGSSYIMQVFLLSVAFTSCLTQLQTNARFQHAMQSTLTRHGVVLATLLVIVYVWLDIAWGVHAYLVIHRINGANGQTGQGTSPCAITLDIARWKMY
jgi:hypothetical protein